MPPASSRLLESLIFFGEKGSETLFFRLKTHQLGQKTQLAASRLVQLPNDVEIFGIAVEIDLLGGLKRVL